MSKRLILLLFLFIALTGLSGCALYWSDDGLLITFMKDYDLIKKTSTSHKLDGKLTVKPLPEIEIKTK